MHTKINLKEAPRSYFESVCVCVCVCGGGGGGGGGLTGDSKSGGSLKHFFLVTLYNFQKGGGTEAPQRSPSPSPSVCPVKRKKIY